MPEGNEIHRYAERHQELFGGQVVTVAAPNGRFADGAALLHRRRLRAVEPFGKHLFYDFGPKRRLHVHLGMFGKFREGEMPYPEPIGALRLRISTAKYWMELRGPTICEVLDEDGQETIVARIGPDPLRVDAKVGTAVERMARSRAPLASLLMDQSVISGIGNVFRAELLYRRRISPFAAGNTVDKKVLRAIWRDAKVLLRAAVTDRRMVTTRSEDRPHPVGKARREERHYVYRRAGLPCFVCGTKVRTREFLGRNLFWCPECQRGDA